MDNINFSKRCSLVIDALLFSISAFGFSLFITALSIFFLLFFPFSNLNAQAESEKETATMQILDTLLEGSLPDTTKLRLFWENVSDLKYWGSKKPFEFARKGLAYAKSVGETYYVGEMQSILGLFYCNTSIFDTSIILLNRALISYEETNSMEERAHVHGILRYLYAQTEEFEKSLEHCYAALKIYEKLEDEKRKGATYGDIAGTLIIAGKYEEALPFAIKGRDILIKHDDVFELVMVLQKMADCYADFDDYKNAISIHNQIVKIAERDSVDLTIKTKLEIYDERAVTHSLLKNYDLALHDLETGRKIIAIHPDLEFSNIYKQTEANILLEQKKYRAAISLFQVVLKAEKESDRTHQFQYLLESLSEAFAALEQYDSAYHYRLEYERLSTEQRGHETGLQMETLKTKYETEKKEATILDQEQRISQQKIIQWFIIGFAGVLGLLFFQSFRNAKLKKLANEALIESNAQLEIKNRENELLLKEIHHRVKNNLQTVSSLLSLQSESISDQSALNAVLESKNRVASMALIHQKLYQGENLAAIEMRDYFETIGKAIIDSFGEKAKNISMQVDMKEIELDVDTAVPIGLITNELITNSIKHAFPNKEKGQILITLTQEKNDILKLHITDNGQPSTKESIAKKEKGFGTLLIQLLTTQLGGALEKSTAAGTSTILQFPLQEKSVA